MKGHRKQWNRCPGVSVGREKSNNWSEEWDLWSVQSVPLSQSEIVPRSKDRGCNKKKKVPVLRNSLDTTEERVIQKISDSNKWIDFISISHFLCSITLYIDLKWKLIWAMQTCLFRRLALCFQYEMNSDIRFSVQDWITILLPVLHHHLNRNWNGQKLQPQNIASYKNDI